MHLREGARDYGVHLGGPCLRGGGALLRRASRRLARRDARLHLAQCACRRQRRLRGIALRLGKRHLEPCACRFGSERREALLRRVRARSGRGWSVGAVSMGGWSARAVSRGEAQRRESYLVATSSRQESRQSEQVSRGAAASEQAVVCAGKQLKGWTTSSSRHSQSLSTC